MVTSPRISFAVACYNASDYLSEAVRSALAQTIDDLEVLIVDDHSTDASLAVARTLAEADHRVRVLSTSHNSGPAGARNLALSEAAGEWFAILDSDDFLHPDRSRLLLEEARTSGADMIADDLLLFDQARQSPPSLFLDRRRGQASSWIILSEYLAESRMYGRRPNLGFLKPMMRTAFLREHAIAYDESLRIAEDDALIIAALRAGARYRLMPQPLYFYRKHEASISHRLSGRNANRMMAASEKLVPALTALPAVRGVFLSRHQAMRDAWAQSELLDAIKARNGARAVRLFASHPTMWPLLRMPLTGALRKLGRKLRPPRPPAPPEPGAAIVISRQRLIGPTNGSSTYLLAIAQALRDAGFVPHLVQPTPRVFGRTPFFKRMANMDVFASHEVLGATAIGRWLVARDMSIWGAAARGMLARVLRRAGLSGGLAEDRKAPPSISAPWTRDQLLFVARQAARRPDLALADYMFQAEALPYLLDPSLPTATVMHDLFHARAGQFNAGTDSVALIDAATENRMLGAARAVLAIQAEEAAYVAQHVPATRAIVVPMPAAPVAAPQPGEAQNLLFVGSDTAPNVLALEWFFETVWDEVLARKPDTTLDVAGTVARGFPQAPKGVRFLGLVPDLSALYARAGVVISPLRHGSGLKIKLIDALARGKACVVTGVTLQGVEDRLSGAVVRADDPGSFAAGIAALQADHEARTRLAAAGLEAARRWFGPDACFAELKAWLAAEAR